MHTLYLEWQAIWKILGVGLILGGGLPALFALGIRALAYGTGGDAEEHPAGVLPAPHPAGRALAYLIFALVLLAVGLGILVIVASGFGKEVSFGSVYPTLQEK